MTRCNKITVVCFILFVSGLVFGTLPGVVALGQVGKSDPNMPTPILPRKALSAHLLPVSADWAQYYDTTPQDTVRLYYNLGVILDIVRQQNARIQQLMTRIEKLEKSAIRLAVPGQAAPDVNAPPTPAVKSGGTTEKKPVE